METKRPGVDAKESPALLQEFHSLEEDLGLMKEAYRSAREALYRQSDDGKLRAEFRHRQRALLLKEEALLEFVYRNRPQDEMAMIEVIAAFTADVEMHETKVSADRVRALLLGLSRAKESLDAARELRIPIQELSSVLREYSDARDQDSLLKQIEEVSDDLRSHLEEARQKASVEIREQFDGRKNELLLGIRSKNLQSRNVSKREQEIIQELQPDRLPRLLEQAERELEVLRQRVERFDDADYVREPLILRELAKFSFLKRVYTQKEFIDRAYEPLMHAERGKIWLRVEPLKIAKKRMRSDQPSADLDDQIYDLEMEIEKSRRVQEDFDRFATGLSSERRGLHASLKEREQQVLRLRQEIDSLKEESSRLGRNRETLAGEIRSMTERIQRVDPEKEAALVELEARFSAQLHMAQERLLQAADPDNRLSDPAIAARHLRFRRRLAVSAMGSVSILWQNFQTVNAITSPEDVGWLEYMESALHDVAEDRKNLMKNFFQVLQGPVVDDLRRAKRFHESIWNGAVADGSWLQLAERCFTNDTYPLRRVLQGAVAQ